MDITLEEIFQIAEDESAKYHHYYVGIEHLFIALTKLRNGITVNVLDVCDIEARFVRYSIRQTLGVNENRRFWPGFPRTPRVQTVLDIAQSKTPDGKSIVTERELFLAILEEGDSIPIRVLLEIGADLNQLYKTTVQWSGDTPAEPPPVPIESTGLQRPLTDEQRMVLERMFRTHEKIIIERELGGGYTGARLLLVQPYRAKRADARVVVKIDERESVLYEKRHYDSYVQYSLPPTTARLLDSPSLPTDCSLGGLKYTFVQPLNNNNTNALDLRDLLASISPHELSSLIRHGIYDNYRETWWGQRQRYRFGVWREYEQVLPAAIEIQMINPNDITIRPRVLKPLEAWSRGDDIRQGEIVVLKGFTVQKIRPHRQTLQLTADANPEAVSRSSKVEVVGIEMIDSYRRGHVLDVIYGRVLRNRMDILQEQLEWLEPEFDIRAPIIPAPEPIPPLPNPIYYLENFLSRQVSGHLSIIHGDLHLGNVIGRGNDAWLIDFGLAREGHTLFDWATLEISILSSFVSTFMPSGWDGVWGTIRLLNLLNRHENDKMPKDHPVMKAFAPIITIRQLVEENLAKQGQWQEYHLALTFLGLRGISWKDTASTDVRRLLFLMSALSTAFVSDADTEIVTSTQATGFDILETAFSDAEEGATSPYKTYTDDDD